MLETAFLSITTSQSCDGNPFIGVSDNLYFSHSLWSRHATQGSLTDNTLEGSLAAAGIEIVIPVPKCSLNRNKTFIEVGNDLHDPHWV